MRAPAPGADRSAAAPATRADRTGGDGTGRGGTGGGETGGDGAGAASDGAAAPASGRPTALDPPISGALEAAPAEAPARCPEPARQGGAPQDAGAPARRAGSARPLAGRDGKAPQGAPARGAGAARGGGARPEGGASAAPRPRAEEARSAGPALAWRGALRRLRNRLAASPEVQARIARLPLLRRRARREAEALMDLVAGFVHSQALLAAVELGILERLMEAPMTAEALAPGLTGALPGAPGGALIEPARLEALLRALAALGLLEREGAGWRTALRGAALLGAPGALAMIRHHGALYADLADPVALLAGRRDTALARVWPYVGGAPSPGEAARYSALMARTQAPVAAETLRAARLGRARHLLDLGGGTGAFAVAAARRHRGLRVTVLDLPALEAPARAAIAAAGMSARVSFAPGDFRSSLPRGADAVSLVRVLYDHGDETVSAILAAAFDALPPGGRLLVSEPMSGGERPRRATDGYFALYCLAMGTGRLRAPGEIAALLRGAGFERVRARPTTQPNVASVLEARRPLA